MVVMEVCFMSREDTGGLDGTILDGRTVEVEEED